MRRAAGAAKGGRAVPPTLSPVDPPRIHLPTPDWDDLLALSALRHSLQRLVEEHRHADRLAQRGLLPRQRILLTGPPDCGQTFVVDRLAAALDRRAAVLSWEAWAAQPPAAQWAGLDTWAASGALLVVRDAQLLGEGSRGVMASPAARLFLAWLAQAPAGPLYVVADVAKRPAAREVTRAFSDVFWLGPPVPEFMERFCRDRLAGWPVSADVIVGLRQVTVGFSYGDLARVIRSAQRMSLLTSRPLEECLRDAVADLGRIIREALAPGKEMS